MSANVTVRHIDGFHHEATSRSHVIVADEPTEVGGSDKGMSPYELLLSALGSWIAITVRMYAGKKGWTGLGGITVELSHERVHAGDCEDCETKDGKLDVIRRDVMITGELTPEQHDRLQEIARRCPVHRTLTGTIEILPAS